MAYLPVRTLDPMRRAQAKSQTYQRLGEIGSNLVTQLGGSTAQIFEAKAQADQDLATAREAIKDGRLSVSQAYEAAVNAAVQEFSPTIGEEEARRLVMQRLSRPTPADWKNPQQYIDRLVKIDAPALDRMLNQRSERVVAGEIAKRTEPSFTETPPPSVSTPGPVQATVRAEGPAEQTVKPPEVQYRDQAVRTLGPQYGATRVSDVAKTMLPERPPEITPAQQRTFDLRERDLDLEADREKRAAQRMTLDEMKNKAQINHWGELARLKRADLLQDEVARMDDSIMYTQYAIGNAIENGEDPAVLKRELKAKQHYKKVAEAELKRLAGATQTAVGEGAQSSGGKKTVVQMYRDKNNVYHAYEVKADENGKPLLDANGKPIPVRYLGTQSSAGM